MILFSRKERNILEAAAAGASASIKLVANIAANLIAFIAMLEFVNAVLSWFGSFVGFRYIQAISCIGGGNRIKPLTRRKSPTNFIT
jgi:nucleoside permease NupC